MTQLATPKHPWIIYKYFLKVEINIDKPSSSGSSCLVSGHDCTTSFFAQASSIPLRTSRHIRIFGRFFVSQISWLTWSSIDKPKLATVISSQVTTTCLLNRYTNPTWKKKRHQEWIETKSNNSTSSPSKTRYTEVQNHAPNPPPTTNDYTFQFEKKTSLNNSLSQKQPKVVSFFPWPTQKMEE